MHKLQNLRDELEKQYDENYYWARHAKAKKDKKGMFLYLGRAEVTIEVKTKLDEIIKEMGLLK